MAIETTPVAVGQKTEAAWGNHVYSDLLTLGITKAQTGTVPVTISTGTAFGTATVVFPTAFATLPTINVTVVSSSIGTGFLVGTLVTLLSATQFTVRVTLSSGVASTITPQVHWIALD